MNPMERMVLAVVDEGYPWTPAMVTAYQEYKDTHPLAIALKKVWLCPYCTQEKVSNNETGSDISCCGEVGHATLIMELK